MIAGTNFGISSSLASLAHHHHPLWIDQCAPIWIASRNHLRHLRSYPFAYFSGIVFAKTCFFFSRDISRNSLSLSSPCTNLALISASWVSNCNVRAVAGRNSFFWDLIDFFFFTSVFAWLRLSSRHPLCKIVPFIGMFLFPLALQWMVMMSKLYFSACWSLPQNLTKVRDIPSTHAAKLSKLYW